MADITAPPLLIIANGNWGGTSLRTVHAVLESAFDVLLDAFEKLPDAPIRVARWSQDPRVFYDYRPYEIRISARDTYWCQYVYQFSHELCHVMTNFDRYREHKHKWFEESLCELASLFVLHRLATIWKEHPPADIAGAVEFAPHFRTYADDVWNVQVDRHDLPHWLTEHIDTLEASLFNRELNRTLAVALLDRFLEDPSLWRACGWLDCWDPSANVTFRDYLDSWAELLHEKDFAARASDLIGSYLGY